MDFAKAFDRVCHRGLIIKLEAYGFHGNLLAWLKDFLSHRKQRVVIGESKSEWREVLSGVPQGSFLGPLLFLIYINDMPGLVSSITKLFAGDTKIVKIIRNRLDVVNLQIDVDKLVTWAKDWQMSFNVYKCKYMIFQNRNYSNLGFDLTMNEEPMTRTYAEKDLFWLGIYLTSDLKWST